MQKSLYFKIIRVGIQNQPCSVHSGHLILPPSDLHYFNMNKSPLMFLHESLLNYRYLWTESLSHLPALLILYTGFPETFILYDPPKLKFFIFFYFIMIKSNFCWLSQNSQGFSSVWKGVGERANQIT